MVHVSLLRCGSEEEAGKRRRIQARAMSSSEEETSLIKTPQPPKADAAADGPSSEKAKAERLRRQKELQARLLQ